MAKNSKGLVFGVILIIGLMFVILAISTSVSANISGEKATSCPKSPQQFAINESSIGNFSCALPSGSGSSTKPVVPYDYVLWINNSVYTLTPTSPNINNFPIFTSSTDACKILTGLSNNQSGKTLSVFVQDSTFNCNSVLNIANGFGIGSIIGVNNPQVSFKPRFNWNSNVTGSAIEICDQTLEGLIFDSVNGTNDIMINDNSSCGFNHLVNLQVLSANLTAYSFNENGGGNNYIQNFGMGSTSGSNPIVIKGNNNWLTGCNVNSIGCNITLISGAKNNQINTLSPNGFVLDESGQINYIETGQSGNVACPALSGGTLTNTLGDKIELIWNIGGVGTTIQKNGIVVSGAILSQDLSLILNGGETSHVSQTVAVTETCWYI